MSLIGWFLIGYFYSVNWVYCRGAATKMYKEWVYCRGAVTVQGSAKARGKADEGHCTGLPRW
jgi:hypothetical protein